jgi:TRAP-type C4-dicarboxylate transport system permease small subunit
MSSIPENNDGVRQQRDSNGVGDAVIAVIALGVLVYGMYYVWNFMGPSGQTMSLGGFIALFLRELLLVGIFGLALVVGCVVWLLRSIRNLFRRGDDAL